MVDEIAEVKQYLDGKNLDVPGNYYRACYMIAKYYKKLQYSERDTFLRVAEWVRKNGLHLNFSLAGCVSSAYKNDRELRCGTRVKISEADADTIRTYATNRPDRRVALALLCCSKAFAEADGSFFASSCALASWLGVDSGNIRQRSIARLVKLGFVERLDGIDTMRGWQKNFYRKSYRFRVLVPYSQDGKWELVGNDIRTLYEQVFHEPYSAC